MSHTSTSNMHPPVIDLSVDVVAGGEPASVAADLLELLRPFARPTRVWWLNHTNTGGDGYVAAQIYERPILGATDRQALSDCFAGLDGTYQGEMATDGIQCLEVHESFDAAFDPDHPDMDASGVLHLAADGVPGRAWWWPGTTGDMPDPAPAAASRKVAHKLDISGPLAAGLCVPARDRDAHSTIEVWTPHLAAALAQALDHQTGQDAAQYVGTQCNTEVVTMTDLAGSQLIVETAAQLLTELWQQYAGKGRAPFAPDTDPTIATHNLLALTDHIDDPNDAALLRWLLTARVTLS